jgi:hypothetical protein
MAAMKTPAPHYSSISHYPKAHVAAGSAYRILGTFATEALNLAIVINTIVLQHSKLGLFALVLDLLGCGVDLLLALLGHAAPQAKDEMEGRLFLDVVVGESAAILELLAGEDETLLVWRDAFLVYPSWKCE